MVNFADKIRAMASNNQSEEKAELILTPSQIVQGNTGQEPATKEETTTPEIVAPEILTPSTPTAPPVPPPGRFPGYRDIAYGAYEGAKNGGINPIRYGERNMPEEVEDAVFETVSEDASDHDSSAFSGAAEDQSPEESREIEVHRPCHLEDLLTGACLPRYYLPLQVINDYKQLNASIQQGKLRLAERENMPVVEVTPSALQLMDAEVKKEGQDILAKIEEKRRAIEQLQQEIEADMPQAQDVADRREAISAALREMGR